MPGPEQRKNERVDTRLEVRIERDGVELVGETINLSLGGTLLRVPPEVKPQIGEHWQVSIVLPTLDQPLRAGAEVRWVGVNDDCGLQFSTGFRAKETWALGQWLDRIRKGQA